MCGIAGIIDLSGKDVSSEAISSMTDIISHRGPDDEGVYVDGNLGLGHRRLSILDLSASGHQPMFLEDRYVIVYNGEVYNYLEIREELILLGHEFQSKSDTEVILRSYSVWGEECVHKFNGMWSFVIYDKQAKTAFCSRDRFGIKPFYYAFVDDLFVFGSEIKQLLPFFGKRIVNKKVLLDYLVFGLEEHLDETFFNGIIKLPASHQLLFNLSDNSITKKKYYSINIDPAVAQLSKEDSTELWKNEFDRAVSYRLRSDVKVGTCLSGGVDSSSIASIASSSYSINNDNKFCAITAKSEDVSNDESGYAKQVVDFSNLDWHLVTPKNEDFKKVLDKVIEAQEEPFGSTSIVMQYFVMEKAKEIDCTVLLDGQGGDETLLGYGKYYPAYLMSLPFLQRVVAFFKSSTNSKLSRRDLLLYMLYFTNAKLRMKRQFKRYSFLKKEYFTFTSKNIMERLAEVYTDVNKLQVFEIEKTQLPHLLRYEDKNSMRHSVETRLPFLDYKLLELSLSINHQYKITDGWTKHILRKSMVGKLPEEVIWRKNKFGFESPAKIWLSDKAWLLKEINKSKILSKLSKSVITEKDDLNLLWKLFNIARWEQIYNVEID
jgi:asparagine synthase (glutamine-hydrolysing)